MRPGFANGAEDLEIMRLRSIHIRKSQIGGGYEVVAPPTRADLAAVRAQREWAEAALYRLMAQPSADGSFDQTIGLPLAAPRSEDSISHCPPVGKVRIDRKVGGLQPSVNTLRPLSDATPKRQASCIVSTYVPPRYHELFCAHDRFRGMPCTQCRRDRAEAREWLSAVQV